MPYLVQAEQWPLKAAHWARNLGGRSTTGSAASSRSRVLVAGSLAAVADQVRVARGRAEDAMITQILSLIDRLIQLIEYRQRRYRTLFDDFLEPAFNDLLLVHNDYIKMFEETRRLLPSISASERPVDVYVAQLKRAAEYLDTKRSEFEALREKLRALGRSVGTDDLDADVARFIEALLAYFYGEWLPGPRVGSATAGLRSVIDTAIDKGQTSSDELFSKREFLDEYVGALISRQRDGWSRVCEAYAPLKLRAAMSV
jgi:hypothetical protein